MPFFFGSFKTFVFSVWKSQWCALMWVHFHLFCWLLTALEAHFLQFWEISFSPSRPSIPPSSFLFFLPASFPSLFFGCIGSLLLHMGFLKLQRAGATLCCSARISHCSGFSCCGARALGMWASVVAVHGLSSCGSRALERRLSSCGAWA